MGQTTTTTFPLVPTERPSSTAGALVFFATFAIIVGGGLVLYFRHRPPREPRTD